jgi:hypothetical protein
MRPLRSASRAVTLIDPPIDYGHRFSGNFSLIKATPKTEITPDLIVIDGAEGGIGAAPAQPSNHVGTPLRERLIFIVNALTATDQRERIKIGGAGKFVNGLLLRPKTWPEPGSLPFAAVSPQ